jgi:26S proteasome regulatory subunit N1
VIPHPISKQAQILVEMCSYVGASNVLKVQAMPHNCNEHVDKSEEDDTHQAFAALRVALIAMGEDVGAEMALRTFDHLVRGRKDRFFIVSNRFLGALWRTRY